MATNNAPFSIESLIAWLEKQPGDKSYFYVSCDQCLLSQYFTACGFENVKMGIDTFDFGPRLREHAGLPEHFNDIGFQHPRTFGAALERAREVAANHREHVDA